MKVAVLLSGCGVYDGSEIHESVFTLLALDQEGHTYQCFAPDKNQYHTINHLTGEEMNETRNCLIESGRISRGNTLNFDLYKAEDFDALVIVGGFGAAKNINQWALKGKDGAVDVTTKGNIISTIENKKQIVAMCMGPTVVASSLANTEYKPVLSVGSVNENSPYDIQSIHQGMESLGSSVKNATKQEIVKDENLKIISIPAYMMEASLTEVYLNIQQGIKAIL